jgi:hypothetical protein
MRKYRRFEENLKGSSVPSGLWGVCNASLGQFFEPLPAAAIGHFGRHGFRFQNGAVTVLSRNGGVFPLILSERAYQNRHFRRPRLNDTR